MLLSEKTLRLQNYPNCQFMAMVLSTLRRVTSFSIAQAMNSFKLFGSACKYYCCCDHQPLRRALRATIFQKLISNSVSKTDSYP